MIASGGQDFKAAPSALSTIVIGAPLAASIVLVAVVSSFGESGTRAGSSTAPAPQVMPAPEPAPAPPPDPALLAVSANH